MLAYPTMLCNLKSQDKMAVSWCLLHGIVDRVQVDEVTHAHFTAVNWAVDAFQLTSLLLHLRLMQTTKTPETINTYITEK